MSTYTQEQIEDFKHFADLWHKLKKSLEFYETGVDENGDPIDNEDLKTMLIRRVELGVFTHWEKPLAKGSPTP